MISPVGLGTAQFAKGAGLSGKYWASLDDREITGIIGAAMEGGVNWIDSAEAYGGGESERAVARGLDNLGYRREDIILASKWFPLFRTSRSLYRTIGKRLDALDTNYLDLYQIHFPWSISSIKAQMGTMARLIGEGHIRHAGVSNFSSKKLITAYEELNRFGIQLVSNQVQYSLLDRSIEFNGVLAAARKLGVTILAYSPLAQGLLSGNFHDDPHLIQRRPGFRKYTPSFRRKNIERSRPLIDALRDIAERHNATATQVALSWTINLHGDVVVAIVGATKIRQARENAAASAVILTDADLARLDTVSRNLT
jgi:aryl-alcohol dehydrogenase-like predicted oxidoreductase